MSKSPKKNQVFQTPIDEKAKRNPKLKTPEKPIHWQALESAFPVNSRESRKRRCGFIKTICKLMSCLLVFILILLFNADLRAVSPIENQLIKMFDKLPTEFETFLRADKDLLKTF